MKSPFFSIVVPTYNRLPLLRQTLASILNQSFTDFEVIVVDNCSTDGTDSYMLSVEDVHVRYIRNDRNYERAFSRNRGLSLATGKFCTLLDSDDIMYPNCLEKAFHFINQNPKVTFFHGLYEIIDQNGKKKKDIFLEPLVNPNKQICQGNFISCIGVFIKTELYQTYRFSEDRRMIGSEDYEIWLRVMVEHPIHRLPGILCGMREHAGRSVYSDMYLNLEFQRNYITDAIECDFRMKENYGPYIHFINSNFYYHQAMYLFYTKQTKNGLRFLLKTVQTNPGILMKRRFTAMVKNLLLCGVSRNPHHTT